MKVGLAFASSIAIEGADTLELCRRAEAAGFESVWGGEHVVLPDAIHSRYPYTEDGRIPAEPDTPIPDPLIWLAYAAAAAPTLRLGTASSSSRSAIRSCSPRSWRRSTASPAGAWNSASASAG